MTAAADARVLQELAELKALLSGGVTTIVERVDHLERAVVSQGREATRFQLAVTDDVSKLGKRVNELETRMTTVERALERARQKGNGAGG